MALPTPGSPAKPADHINRGDENRDFALGMMHTHPTSAGWALTALFYSALHYTEAYFLKTSIPSQKHRERNDAIKHNPVLRKIYPQYKYLCDYGWNARYNTSKIYGKVDVDKAKPFLEAVERHMKSLLSGFPE